MAAPNTTDKLISELTDLELGGVIGDAIAAGIDCSDAVWRIVDALETIAASLEDPAMDVDIPRATTWRQWWRWVVLGRR